MLPDDRPLKVLVAGAEINGLMTAHLLLREGAHVTLCDCGPIPNPGAASHGRHRLVHPWHQGEDLSVAADAERALSSWQKILKELGIDGFETTGVLVHGQNGHPSSARSTLLPRLCGRSLFIIKDFAPPRTTTPPSGVSVRTDSGRTRNNPGAIQFCQVAEKTSPFKSVSILVKGGWKETRGVQRPISGHRPVSESRMAPLNPFETERKKALLGASAWVRDL